MKITAKDDSVIIKEVYSGVTLETAEGKQLHICMRDFGFEMRINDGPWHMVNDDNDFKEVSTVSTTDDSNINGQYWLSVNPDDLRDASV